MTAGRPNETPEGNRSMLYICGDEDFAREVYAREGRAYWSAALPAVLEKHGLIDVEVAGPGALRERRTWETHAVVLVARLPAEAWDGEVIDLMQAGRAGVIVEGPLPDPVQRALGVSAAPAGPMGVVANVAGDIHAAATAFGYPASGRVAPATGVPVARRDDLDWSRIDGVPLTAAQAAAWRAPGWDATELSLAHPDARALGWWAPADGGERRWPALVERDRLIGCCFSLFAFLGQRHTAEPTAGAEHRSAPRGTGLETLLLALIDRLHARVGASRTRVKPWPDGVRWARNVRHDYDRSQPAEKIEAVLAGHRRVGAHATWYWRARHVADGGLPAVARAPGHEIALHTELPWIDGATERETVETASGQPVRGSSAHGDPDCFRFQGAASILWAEQAGLDYTELVQQAHYLPHRCALLGEDGTVSLSRVICLPHHESFDRSTTPGDVAVEHLHRATPQWIAASGLMQVMNHPDQNVEQLMDFLDEQPAEGRWDVTAAQAVEWWRATHVDGALSLGPDETVSSRSGVTAAVLETRRPDGTVEERVVTLPAGGTVRLADAPLVGAPDDSPASSHDESPAPAHDVLPVPTHDDPPAPSSGVDPPADAGGPDASAARWSAISEAFGAEVRAYLHRAGRKDGEPGLESTVRTNTELVPGRSEDIVLIARDLGGIFSLREMRLIDVGSGWGVMTTYLASTHAPRKALGVEMREEFVAAAKRATADLGLSNLDFAVDDMTTLATVPDGAFDLVIVNNALIYVAERAGQLDALRAFRRVLAPGGRLVVYQANRWVLREPFTRAPVVHLLGPAVGPAVARVTGWGHNHGRVRYASPRDLRRLMKSAGFTDIRTGALRSKRVVSGRQARFERFFGAVGRRAD